MTYFDIYFYFNFDVLLFICGSFCCLNSTVNIASCLLGSAQSNMAHVKSKLLQSVIISYLVRSNSYSTVSYTA